MFVERYFHIRSNHSHRGGGATVRVCGDTERVGQVDVQVTFCNTKDPFCRKTGREYAKAQPIKVVPLRYLSRELGRIELEELNRHGHAYMKSIMREAEQEYTNSWNFAMRYFLPKE